MVSFIFMLIFRLFHSHPLSVENSCGKVCGQCGKLLVFNSYFDCGNILDSLWKTGHPWFTYSPEWLLSRRVTSPGIVRIFLPKPGEKVGNL